MRELHEIPEVSCVLHGDVYSNLPLSELSLGFIVATKVGIKTTNDLKSCHFSPFSK